MADLMQQARELLAAEYEDSGCRGIAMHYRSKDFIASSGDESIVLRAIAAALSATPEGYVLVPVEPSLGVLSSMAIRRDHGLGCPGYYDAPVFGAENVGHQRRMEVAIGEARQQYEEVVGNGFYSLDREGHYAGLASRPQGVKDV